MMNEMFLPPAHIKHLKGVSTLKNLREDAVIVLESVRESYDGCIVYLCEHIPNVIHNMKRYSIFANVINQSLSPVPLFKIAAGRGFEICNITKYNIANSLDNTGITGYTAIAKELLTIDCIKNTFIYGTELYHVKSCTILDISSTDYAEVNLLREEWLNRLINDIDARLALESCKS